MLKANGFIFSFSFQYKYFTPNFKLVMCWFFFQKIIKICLCFHFSRKRWCRWSKLFPWKTMIYLSHTVFTMAADVLVMEGTFENIVFKMSASGCDVLNNMIIGHSGWIIYMHSSSSCLGHTRHIFTQVKSCPPDEIIIMSGILKLCLTFKNVPLSTANPLPMRVFKILVAELTQYWSCNLACTSGVSRLLHGLNLVAVGLSVRYER